MGHHCTGRGYPDHSGIVGSCDPGRYLVDLAVQVDHLGPQRPQRKLFEVGHCAFYGAMGTFVEGCQNRKK